MEKYWYHSEDPVQISIYVQFQRNVLDFLMSYWNFEEYVKHESEASQVLDLISIQIS